MGAVGRSEDPFGAKLRKARKRRGKAMELPNRYQNTTDNSHLAQKKKAGEAKAPRAPGYAKQEVEPGADVTWFSGRRGSLRSRCRVF